MSNISQDILFPGSGLNQDDHYNYVDLGSAPYRLNVFVSGDGATGVLTNMLGNTRTVDVNDHLLKLSHTYITVGSYYNRLTRKVYYWVFSQPYDISIPQTTTTTTPAPWEYDDNYIYDNKLFCYNEDTETLDLIFTDTKNYFGLDINYPMRDCSMIGNWLYFNPRISEPKMIDVEMAYNYTNYDVYTSKAYVYGDKVTFYGGLFMANTAIVAGESPSSSVTKWTRIGNCYSDNTPLNFDSEFRYAFNVIKQSPLYLPTCTYDYNSVNPINNVKNLVFQFTNRHKYFDNSYSVYSSYSDLTLPTNSEHYNGEIDAYAANLIRVNIALPSPSLVKEVEIVFRIIGENIWKRAKIINRRDIGLLTGTTYTFDFYNDESYIVVDSVEVATIESYVPQKAKSQEIINKNILCYGGCTEGFDNLDKNLIDVSLTPELLSYAIPATVGSVRRDNIHSVDIVHTTEAEYHPSTHTTTTWDVQTMSFNAWYATAGIIAGDIYSVMIDTSSRRSGTGASEHSYTIQPADVTTIGAFVTAIGVFLKATYPDYVYVVSIGANTIKISSNLRGINFIESRIYASPGGVNPILYKRRGFKTGSYHPFCIYYYDGAMRRWDAQTSKENIAGAGYEMLGTKVYVPSFNEVSPLPTDTANRWVINWEVNHRPPAGAKYWRWGYAGGSLCSSFVQYIIKGIADETTDPPDTTRIDITPLQLIQTATAGWNEFPNTIIPVYTWAKGDRIRFITKAKGAGMGDVIDGVYDFEIIKFDDTDSYIYIQRFIWAGMVGDGSLVEIYRPLKENTETVYYEFGEVFPLVEDADGVVVHTGSIQDQVSSTNTPATGIFDTGDVYHIMRTPSYPISTTKSYFHESMWWSDFYASDNWNKGKIGLETTFGQRFLNIIRYSRPYFQNTEINGLPTFEEAEGWAGYKELNDIYGDIVAIYEMGDTLKVYQERKASSILVGRTEYMDSTGAVNVAISTTVLGAIRYSPSNYSTIFPESIARNNKFLYGFDIYNGVAWRDGVNGIFPISGRYAEAGGDADYKMQTYFKLKAKALMESGVDHVDVLGCWDEEYKNFYLTFKDYVVDANNETIVFHEPSNRWISFVGFTQTPSGGYNVPLELAYAIVKGFEGGINFFFNEDTRFAEFWITTPPNYAPTMDIAPLTITTYDPTVIVDCGVTGDVAGVVLTAYDPTCTITLLPNVILTSIDYISSAPVGYNLYIFVHYSNAGDPVSGTLDWRILDLALNVVDSGTSASLYFNTTADGSMTIGPLTYTSPAGLYYIEVKKSTDAWGSAINWHFTSL
jgi:hypothetical protein